MMFADGDLVCGVIGLILWGGYKLIVYLAEISDAQRLDTFNNSSGSSAAPCPKCGGGTEPAWGYHRRCTSCQHVFKFQIPKPESFSAPKTWDKVPSKGDCPSCNNSHIRLWDGEYRCWNCGYVLRDEPEQQSNPIPPVIQEVPLNIPELPTSVEQSPALPPLPSWQTGTRVIIEEMPLDTYEAAQVMRRLKPNLGPFEILEAIQFESERDQLLQGFEPAIAEGIKTDFEQAGCRVSLQVIEKVQAVPEPEPKPVRAPTEEEFHEIRMGSDQARVAQLISGGDLDLNAVDEHGYPLLHGCQSAVIVNLLAESGIDMQCRDRQGNTALHHCDLPEVQETLLKLGLIVDGVNHRKQTPLHIWAGKGQVSPIECLLVNSANPLVDDADGNTPLEYARLANDRTGHTTKTDHARVIALLEEFASTSDLPPILDVRCPTETEFYEIRLGKRREFINLISGGELDLNANDQQGCPLLHGVQKEHMAKLLIQHGADPLALDQEGHTALHYCDVSAVQQVFIEQGTPINAQANNGETALHIWAGRGCYEAVKTLLHFGANPAIKDHTGHTPLQTAQLGLEHGGPYDFQSVIKLLQANEPLPPVIEPTPTPGRPPTDDEFFDIRYAMGDEVRQIKKLIESGPIDVNARDEFNRPLVFGVSAPKILNLLVQLGADIHAKNDYNSSVLHDCDEPAVCHLLIQLGVNPNIRDDQMCTPLHDCMEAAVMRVLIEHGGEIDARDNSGNTPLHQCTDGESARELIKAGAEIDAVNTDGVTPLIEAAAMGRFDVVKTLIEHGADIAHQSDSVTDRRKTALAAAENHIWDGDRDYQRNARENCEKIAQLLREHGAK